jgi:PAS domain S-box-containing protein
MPFTPLHQSSNTSKQHAVETQALNEMILSAAPLGFAVYRAGGPCVQVNDLFCQITQFPRERLLQQNFRQLDSWQTSGMLQTADAALSSGNIQVIDVHMNNPTGHEAWMICRMTSFELADQPYLLLTVEDVMKERKAEEQLQRQKIELEQHVAQQTAALRQSEQTLRSLIDAFPELAVLITPQGTALAANRNFASRFSLTTEQIIGTHILDLLPPDLAASRGSQIQKVIATGQPCEFEDARAGRILNNVVNPVFDVNGQLLSLAVFAFDITQRKQNQEDLYQSRQMLRAVMDTIPQRVFWKDRQLHYLGCNLPFASDVGVASPEKIVGLSDYDLHEQEFAEQFRAFDAEVIESGLPKLGYEERQLKPDGNWMWLHTSKVPLRDPAGNIIGVLGVYEDISDRKRMETELRDSEERFRTTFEQAPIGIVHTSPERRFLRVNPCFCRMVGYSAEELMGLSFTQITHQDNSEDNIHNLGLMLEGKVPNYVTDKRYIRKDGSLIWAHITVSLVRGAQEEPKYFVTIVEDITARKQAQALLEERTHDLARSNADLEQFAYVASHDLQEPLRMVSSFTQLLERRYRGQLDERANEYIHFITDGSQRMHRLINDLLSYSRVGTRGRPFAAVELESVLAQAAENLQITLEESGALLTHDPLPVVYADEIQLVQLLQNLIANAVKFRSTEPPSIYLSAAPRGNEWAIAVRDNGIGIEPQYFERIFVIFQRLHLREEYPGTGIGLAICKKIVGRHGGQIWVESTPGQGATFTFTVPAFSSQSTVPPPPRLAT